MASEASRIVRTVAIFELNPHWYRVLADALNNSPAIHLALFSCTLDGALKDIETANRIAKGNGQAPIDTVILGHLLPRNLLNIPDLMHGFDLAKDQDKSQTSLDLRKLVPTQELAEKFRSMGLFVIGLFGESVQTKDQPVVNLALHKGSRHLAKDLVNAVIERPTKVVQQPDQGSHLIDPSIVKLRGSESNFYHDFNNKIGICRGACEILLNELSKIETTQNITKLRKWVTNFNIEIGGLNDILKALSSGSYAELLGTGYNQLFEKLQLLLLSHEDKPAILSEMSVEHYDLEEVRAILEHISTIQQSLLHARIDFNSNLGIK